jgi:hypothetical protein
VIVDISHLEDPADDIRSAIAELSGRPLQDGRGLLA